VDEASSVDAVVATVGPEDPSTRSVVEGSTGVAIGEGTTVVVSGTEDLGEAYVSRSTEESSVLAPAVANRPGTESSIGSDRLGSTLLGERTDALPSAPGESAIRGRSKRRTADWISINTHAQIFCDRRIHNRSTHRYQKIRVPRSNDRYVRRRCYTWKFWQGTLLHRGVSRLRQICNIHSTTSNQRRINQGWRKERDF
jgi:hypothetical protein